MVGWPDPPHVGAVYVFKRDVSGWTEMAKLTATDEAVVYRFGRSVSMQGDYLLIGAPGTQENGEPYGAAYMFLRQGDSWVL